MLIPMLTAGPWKVSEVTEPIWMPSGSGHVKVGYPFGKLGYSSFKYLPPQPLVNTCVLSDALIHISVARKSRSSAGDILQPAQYLHCLR